MRQTAPAMLSPAQPKPSAFLHSLDPKRTFAPVATAFPTARSAAPEHH